MTTLTAESHKLETENKTFNQHYLQVLLHLFTLTMLMK